MKPHKPLTLEQRIERLEKIAFTKTKTWVKAGKIMELTGWSHEGMRKAREQGLVQFTKENGFWYLIESINPMFLKEQYRYSK